VACGKYVGMWLIYMWLNLFPLYFADDFIVIFVASKISVSHRPLDSTASFLSRGQVYAFYYVLS
jgi:hypothetical protein